LAEPRRRRTTFAKPTAPQYGLRRLLLPSRPFELWLKQATRLAHFVWLTVEIIFYFGYRVLCCSKVESVVLCIFLILHVRESVFMSRDKSW
jgi:hypothetical protein